MAGARRAPAPHRGGGGAGSSRSSPRHPRTGGSARADLERRASGIENLRFIDMQPKDRLPELLAAGDIHVVPLRRGLARSSVPSKMYSILAAGRPIVASVDPGTEVARVVEQA